MKKKYFATICLIVFLLLVSASAALADAEDTGFAWQNHAAPFGFTFGNLIDNHQQMRELNNGKLQGYIYIQFTGEIINGVPVARRADCDNPELDCRVGWEVTGTWVEGAKLVQKGPRLWDIEAANLPEDPEFTHFHWIIGSDGRNPKKPCGLVIYDETAPVTYQGYLFKRTALATFYWLGGNEDKETGRLVTPGIDLHSNLLERWTGGGGGHDGGHDGGEPGGGDDMGGCGGHDTGGEEPGGDTGCGGHDTGEEPGGDTGCGGHDTGEEPGGDPGGSDPGGCGDDSGCAGH